MKARDTKRAAAAVAALNALKRQADPLERLDLVRQAREAADALEASAVAAARDSGHTWAEIGDVYGLTKQGAQQRFRKS